MLKINKLQNSPFYNEKYKWVTTREIIGSFGEVELEGYYEKGIMFNSIFYDKNNYYTIELDDTILAIVEFDKLPKEFQKIIDLESFEKIQKREDEEYAYFKKLKSKYEQTS